MLRSRVGDWNSSNMIGGFCLTIQDSTTTSEPNFARKGPNHPSFQPAGQYLCTRNSHTKPDRDDAKSTQLNRQNGLRHSFRCAAYVATPMAALPPPGQSPFDAGLLRLNFMTMYRSDPRGDERGSPPPRLQR